MKRKYKAKKIKRTPRQLNIDIRRGGTYFDASVWEDARLYTPPQTPLGGFSQYKPIEANVNQKERL